MLADVNLQCDRFPVFMKTTKLLFIFLFLCNYTFSQRHTAIDSLEKVLQTNIADKTRADVYNKMAKHYAFNSDSAKTCQLAFRAIKLSQQIGYPQGIINANTEIGRLYAYEKHYPKAMAIFKKNLILSGNIGYKSGVAKAYKNLGDLHRFQGHFQEALKYYHKSLQIGKELDDNKEVVFCYVGIGRLYTSQNKYAKALNHYFKALKISKENDCKAEAAICFNRIGRAYMKQSKYTKALEYLFKSLAINKQLGHQVKMSATYSNIGDIYEAQGDYAKSLEHYLKSVKIDKELGNKLGAAYGYGNIGIVYDNQGRYSEALKYYLKALRILQEAGDEWGVAVALNNIGDIYKSQNNNARALEYYFKSLKIKEGIGNKRSLAYNYNNIGAVYKKQKKYNKALAYLRKALNIAKEIKDKSGLADAYISLGEVLVDQGKYAQANNYFSDAVSIRRKLGQKALLAKAFICLGTVFYHQKGYTKALKHLHEGITMAKEAGKPDVVRDAAQALAQVYEAQGDFRNAYRNYKLFKRMSDSLFNEDNTKKITRLESEYSFQQEKDSIKFIQEKKQLKFDAEIHTRTANQRGTYIGLGLMILLLIASLFFYRDKQKSHHKLNRMNENLAKSNEEIATVNEQLNKLNEFKNRMTNMIIHDLKDPLASIIGITLSSTQGRLDKTKVASVAQQMLHMVQNILDVQKSEEAEVSFSIGNTTMGAVIKEVIAQQRIFASAKNINLRYDMLFGDVVKADQNVLIRIFSNLISNAIKFTPENGEVRLYSSYVDQGTMLRIEVHDTGAGIRKNQLNKVFDKFYSVALGQQGHFRSTGLGLTFCKLAVEKQEGTIGVSSEEGKGCVFWFTLPLIAKAGEQGKEMLEETAYTGLSDNIILNEVTKVNTALKGKDLKLAKAIVAQIRKQGVNHTYPIRLTKIFNVVKEKVTVSKAVDDWMQMLQKDASNAVIFEALMEVDGE